MKIARFLLELTSFSAFYLYELVVSSLRVAHDVVTPRDRMRPGIIAFRTAARTDVEVMILSSSITLTPGTLCIAVSPDRRTLYVHAMFVDDDADAVRDELRDTIERRVLSLVRSWPWSTTASPRRTAS